MGTASATQKPLVMAHSHSCKQQIVIVEPVDMRTASDEQIAEDLVLGVWAAIALLGAARQCADLSRLTDLLTRAERILSGVIPHIARWGLTGSPGTEPDTVH